VLTGSILLAIPLLLSLAPAVTNQFVFNTLITLLYISAAVLFIAGRPLWLHLILPFSLLVLFFMVLQWALNLISLSLQYITAVEANLMLKFIGLVARLDGLTLVLPTIDITIDHTCNGVNNITALVILAMLLWYSGRKTVRARAALIFFAVLLGLLLNGMRVALIGIWAELVPGADPHGLANLFYEKFIFVLGSILLLYLSDKLNIKKDLKTSVQESKISQHKTAPLTSLQANLITSTFLIVVFLIKLFMI
jgi:exosortase/archaeosortase family protein